MKKYFFLFLVVLMGISSTNFAFAEACSEDGGMVIPILDKNGNLALMINLADQYYGADGSLITSFELELSDQKKQIILAKTSYSQFITLPDLPSGTYILKLRIDDLTLSEMLFFP